MIYTYIYIKVKLATVVEGNLKAPFSRATTPKCRGKCYSFSWIAQPYTYFIMPSVTQPEIESRSHCEPPVTLLFQI